jgi:hypothetical protein
MIYLVIRIIYIITWGFKILSVKSIILKAIWQTKKKIRTSKNNKILYLKLNNLIRISPLYQECRGTQWSVTVRVSWAQSCHHLMVPPQRRWSARANRIHKFSMFIQFSNRYTIPWLTLCLALVGTSKTFKFKLKRSQIQSSRGDARCRGWAKITSLETLMSGSIRSSGRTSF